MNIDCNKISLECQIITITEVHLQQFFNEALLINEQTENYIIELEKLAIKKIHDIVVNLSIYHNFRFQYLIPSFKQLVSMYLLRNNSENIQKLLIDYI